MEQSPLISVIIPVYNVENYLSQCVDSILIQTYANVEIILVNDAATDNSGKICADYAKVNSNVKVLTKDNGGAGMARNAGLDIASGEWIIFQDADDFWDDKNGLQNLIDFHHSVSYEVDLIFFNYKRYFQKDKDFIDRPDFSKDLIDTVDKDSKVAKLFLNAFIPAPPWGKLIKKKFLLDNKIYFPNLRSSEDIPWFMKLIINSTNFTFTNLRFHVYRKQVETSLTYAFNKKKYDTLYEIVASESAKYESAVEKTKYHHYIMSFFAYQYLILLSMSVNFKMGVFLAEQKQLKKLSWLLKYNRIKKVQQIQKLMKILPQHAVSYLLNYYAKKVVNKK